MTGETKKITPGRRLAQIFSDVFSPLLVPTYGMALAMWMTSLRVLPESSRLLATLMIGLITGLAPMSAIIALMRMGRVSDASISQRSQRMVPYLITFVCYVAAGIFLNHARAPFWLQLFFYGAALAIVIATIITLWWKISAHTTAMGGFVGLLLWFAVSGTADMPIVSVFSAGVIIAGAVASSRVALGRHTLGQVAAGMLLGFVSTFVLIYFFYF